MLWRLPSMVISVLRSLSRDCLKGLCSWLEPVIVVVLGFVGVEGCCVTEGQADVVEALCEAELAERVNLEGCVKALCVGDGLIFERDGELIVRCLGCTVEKQSDVFF